MVKVLIADDGTAPTQEELHSLYVPPRDTAEKADIRQETTLSFTRRVPQAFGGEVGYNQGPRTQLTSLWFSLPVFSKEASA